MTRKPHLSAPGTRPRPGAAPGVAPPPKGQVHEGNESSGGGAEWGLGLKRIGAVRGSGLEPGGGFQDQAWKVPRKCGGEG